MLVAKPPLKAFRLVFVSARLKYSTPLDEKSYEPEVRSSLIMGLPIRVYGGRGGEKLHIEIACDNLAGRMYKGPKSGKGPTVDEGQFPVKVIGGIDARSGCWVFRRVGSVKGLVDVVGETANEGECQGATEELDEQVGVRGLEPAFTAAPRDGVQ